ncbi:MAG: Crp/Fnr family transcriptional regulator [Pseudomonadota bacterium]
MIEKHLLKLRARDEIGAEEERAIRDAVSDVVDYPADKTIIEPNRLLSTSTLLIEGMMARYKDLSEGQRQITELHVPGDFVDLHSFTLKKLDHAILTLTRCKAAIVPHANLQRITEQFPHLTRVLWFSTNLDACIAREGEVSLGRRTAIQRTAHLFCELRIRLCIVGLTQGDSYPLELTQIELAECLGLTAVHVNRVLKELRERGLMEFRSGRVTILDLAALERVADFDSNYLYLERVPR